MPLPAGTKLGTYEVRSAIGAGGMGEVYQAHDTKLGRDVAIKVLPEAFAHDPERLARFQREAKMLAQLNHTNIATIYGLEHSNDTHYLVMELVPGDTLQRRVQRDGAVPIEEALAIAKQIAEALEAAHEKGIIHRDLKPANVKLTPEGKVKVLDFGLAKAFAGDTSTEDMGNSPTLSMAATMQGVILGTAAYMSPEQAKGKAVDKRTDIFAFGCVLYELLTGKPTFHGEDITDILAAVVRAEPDWSRLPEATPHAIRTLLGRCLRKDRRQRLPDAGAARIEIEEALAAPATVEPDAPQLLRPVGWIALAAILLLALAASSFVHFREAPPAPPPEMRTEIVTPPTSDPVSFALSPDGRQIVFVASGDGTARLWLRRLDVTSAQPLGGTEGASDPFWSPDNRSVGFFAGSKLKRIDIGGGSPQTLTDAINRGGTWGPDGTILFTRNVSSPLSRIPASGGGPVAVTKLEKQNSHRFPQFLPGGQKFLFYAQGSSEAAGIYLGSLDSPETKRLAAADTAGVYSPEGWLLFIRGGTLQAQRLDLGRGILTGDPVTVADPVAFDSDNVGALSVSASGLVAYRAGGAGQRQLVWFDRSGKTMGTLGAPDANNLMAPSLSPDGRQAAVFRTVQGSANIWLLDATRITRFTFDPNLDRYPIWSPDGSRIVFDSNRKGHRDLYVKPSNGAGSEDLLVESAQDKGVDDWSHDGRFLLFHSSDPQTFYDLWMLPMEGDRKPFVFLKTNFDERRAQFSPDGHWVVYTSNESGRYEIYLRPFNGNAPGAPTGGQWQVSTSGGISPKWRADGKELYYIAPDGKLMAVPIATSSATIAPGTPVALFQTRIAGGATDVSFGNEYDVSNDGRFLINTVLEDAASPITLLQNWTAGLKK